MFKKKFIVGTYAVKKVSLPVETVQIKKKVLKIEKSTNKPHGRLFDCGAFRF